MQTLKLVCLAFEGLQDTPIFQRVSATNQRVEGPDYAAVWSSEILLNLVCVTYRVVDVLRSAKLGRYTVLHTARQTLTLRTCT